MIEQFDATYHIDFFLLYEPHYSKYHHPRICSFHFVFRALSHLDMLFFYGMLHYFSSIAILTIPVHLAHALRPIPFIDPNRIS